MELRPAMVSGNRSFASLRRKREPDCEARWNTECAAVADEDGVEVGAISATRITSVENISTSPTLSSLVVLHRGDHMSVNGAGHLQIRMRMSGIHYLAGPRPDLAVDGHATIGLQPMRQLFRIFIARQPRAVEKTGLAALLAHGAEPYVHC